MSQVTCFRSLSLAEVREGFAELYRNIVAERGRLEIVDEECDGKCGCVLISKAELDSLENALEILADSDRVRAMESALCELAAMSETQPAQA